jgi:hypothetical protein
MPRASQQAAAAKDHEAPTEADAVMNKPRCGEAPGLGGLEMALLPLTIWAIR